MASNQVSLPTEANGVNFLSSSIDKYILVVVFAQSRTAAYEASVQIAKNAEVYGEGLSGKTKFHFAGFGKELEQVSKSLAISKLLANMKNIQFYARGKMLYSGSSAAKTIGCYYESMMCSDYKAHCHYVHPSPKKGSIHNYTTNIDMPGRKFIIPCSFLVRWEGLLISKDHPSTPINQIQAASVEQGCNWCPNFHPEDFRVID